MMSHVQKNLKEYPRKRNTYNKYEISAFTRKMQNYEA